MKDPVLADVRQLASGTIGRLIYNSSYAAIDAKQAEFIDFVTARPMEFGSWVDAWNAYRGTSTEGTIHHLLRIAGFGPDDEVKLSTELATGLALFGSWGATTHCGKECGRVIKTAIDLLEATDPVAHQHIWAGVIQALGVICLG